MSDIDAIQAQAVSIESSDNGTKMVVNADGSINTMVNRLSLDAGKVFGFAIEQNQASTGEQPLILLRNPSASGKTMYLGRIAVGTVDSITRFRLRVYQKPTVTSVGTAGTVYSNQVKSSPATAVALVYTLPSVSANGTRIRTYSQADTGLRDESLVYGISIAAGQDLLVTGDIDASNKVLFVNMTWSEE